MPFQAIAILSGNRQKTIPNRSEEQLLSEVVLPFVANGIITAKWGKKKHSYRVLELRVFETTTARLSSVAGGRVRERVFRQPGPH